MATPRDSLTLPAEVKVSELEVGDIVRFSTSQSDWAFADGIVEKIEDGIVHYARPYLNRPGFSHTGGVTVLIGVEHFSDFSGGNKTVILLEKADFHLERQLAAEAAK